MGPCRVEKKDRAISIIMVGGSKRGSLPGVLPYLARVV